MRKTNKIIFFITVIFFLLFPKLIFAAPYYVLASSSGQKPYLRFIDAVSNKINKEILVFPENFKSGFNIASCDMTGDGSEEIIVAPKTGYQPEIKIISKKGKILNKFLAFPEEFRGGLDVACGDLDNNGVNEIVAVPGAGYEPEVKIFRRYNQASISITELSNKFLAFNEGFKNGLTIAVDDINNDQKDEIIVGAGIGGNPHIKVFENTEFKNQEFLAFNKKFRGGINVSSGDIDYDGYNEISACQINGNICKIYSYALQNKPIFKLKLKQDNSSLNFADIDSNHKEEILIPINKNNKSSIYALASTGEKNILSPFKQKLASEVLYLPDDAYNFIVYGDTQYVTRLIQWQASEVINNQKYDFLLHVGDFTKSSNQNQWEILKKSAKNIYNKKPPKDLDHSFFPIRGNHDMNSQQYAKLFNYYPVNQNYYSFDYKNTHVIGLDSNLDFLPQSEQYNWLVNDLKNTDKQWKVVFLHHPIYTSLHLPKTANLSQNIRDFLVPLFEQYQVNIVFNGHAHIYERTFPILENEINFDSGILYVTTGIAVKHDTKDFYIYKNWWSEQYKKNTPNIIKASIENNYANFYVYNIREEIIDQFRLESR